MHQRAEPEGLQGPSLLVHAGAKLCALPASQVSEVMRALPIHHLAGAPPFIPGLAVVRGRPVPVIDLAMVLDGTTPPGDGARLFVTVRVARPGGSEQLVALLVSRVLGLRRLDGAGGGDSPPLVERLAGEAIAAVASLDEQLVVILRTTRVVPDDAWAVLEAGSSAASPGPAAALPAVGPR